MGYYKIKSHAGTGKLLNIAASGPISGRKNTNIWRKLQVQVGHLHGRT